MPRTCLIAAHDPWLLQLLRVYSEECGFQVIQVHDCQDVLPIIQKEHPAVLLLQIDLPGHLQVRELLNLIRHHPQSRLIPILALGMQAKAAGDRDEGITAYLPEPVTYEIFVDALQKAGICV